MPSFEQIEFYRNCLILIPDMNDPEDSETILILPQKKKERLRLFCSCCRGTTPGCRHAKRLSDIYSQYSEYTCGKRPADHFASHFFHTLFAPVAKQNVRSVDNVCILLSPDVAQQEIITVSHAQEEKPVMIYRSQGADRKRFLSRFHHGSSGSGKRISRHARLRQAARFVLTDIEKETASRGAKTSRMAQEESIWFRLAYHCYREFDGINLFIIPEIESGTGLLKLSLKKSDADEILSVFIPRTAVVQVLDLLMKQPFIKYPFHHIDDEKELLFRFDVSRQDRLVKITPVVQLNPENDSAGYHEIDERFIYGNNAYLPGVKTFITFTWASMQILAQRWNTKKILTTETVSDLLQNEPVLFSINKSIAENTSNDTVDLFATGNADDLCRIINMRLINKFDRVEWIPESTEGDWCSVSISYQAGDAIVSLADILKTQKDKRRYLFLENSIIDCYSDAIAAISAGLGQLEGGSVRIHRASLLQLSRDPTLAVSIQDKRNLFKNVHRFLSLETEKPLMPVEGMRTTLRQYQFHGVQWLLFLYD